MVSLNQSTDSLLSVAQVQSYWNDGVVYPLTAISEQEAAELIPRFTQLRDRMDSWVNCKQLLKVHLVSRWVYDLASSKRVLDAVEGILGPQYSAVGRYVLCQEAESYISCRLAPGFALLGTQASGWGPDSVAWSYRCEFR